MELLFSSIAIVISISSLLWTIFSSRAQRQLLALTSNNTNIVGIASQISELPNVLKFHGIENPEEELKKHDVTAEEFAYLVGIFILGGTYYRTAPNVSEIFAKGSYRHNMCLAPATRRAWPLLRRMITKSPYRDRLDEIIEKLDQQSCLYSLIFKHTLRSLKI